MTKHVEAWDGTTEYKIGDEVTKHGATYRALRYINNALIQPRAGENGDWERVETPVHRDVPEAPRVDSEKK
jgi:hypothetical protein